MKTTPLLFLLFFPFLLFSQPKLPGPPLEILEEGERLIAIQRLEEAIVYAQTVLARPKLSSLDKSQALLVLGRAYARGGDSESSVLPFEQGLALARSTKHEVLKMKALVALGMTLFETGFQPYDSSLMLMEEAKPIAELQRDTISLARIYNILANIYTELEDYNKVRTNCTLCYSLLNNSRFFGEEASCYNTFGRSLVERYFREGDTEDIKTAISYFEKAVELYMILGNRRYEAYARGNIGASAAFINDYKRAEEETLKTIKLGEELKDSSILLDGYYNLATNYEGENRLEEAQKALNQVSALLVSTGTAGDIAFVTDQFSNNEVKISVALVKNRVELLAKQMEITKSAEEKQLLWFICILMAVIIISIFFYTHQRSKLSAQKEKLIQEELENTLKTQEIKFMRARFEGEEAGRHRIARQIHDGVGGLLVSAKWNLESALQELSQREAKVVARLNENLRLQENSYKELRRVVHALEREDTLWWEDLQQFYQQLSNNTPTKIKFYTYNLDNRIAGAFGEEPRLIVQEIITNALKHAKATLINVQINLIEDVLGIIVEDNGIGFDPEKATKGVGLRSIEERCTKLHGTVSYETGRGAGTTVFVDIPLKKQNILNDNPLLYAGTN